MITTGGFQDLVQLSLDTLYMLGPMLQVGDSLASTVTWGMSNSGGALAVAASQTSNETIWFPNTNGTLLVDINISAGTTSGNVSAVTFANGNNVSFGYDGTNITASINVSAANINISAGTTSNESSAFTFANGSNVSFGINAGTITASVASSLTGINVSAGTTSNNLSAITFSNSNNATFGLNGSTLTVSAPVNFSAGTTSNNLTQLSFANGSGVTFGLNGGTLTASVAAAGITAINVSAGTTSNNMTAVTFANSNGLSFGLNGSVVTAKLGGISSWSNGVPATALTGGQNTLFFMPIIVPYDITVTNLMWLASVSNKSSNVSGGLSVSAALYSLNGGTALSLASSGSTNLTWTSGAALSSNTGINYQQMSLNSWNVTPGPYLFAWWVSTQGSATVSYYGNPQQPVISSGQVAAMSNLMLNGYSQATTNALPSSFGITNTASYIRTGATAAEQPFIIFQGT
jgi:hypothetical protein